MNRHTDEVVQHKCLFSIFVFFFPNPFSLLCIQIAELEAQCNEANQEKQKNAQLTVRVQELQAELQEKEMVRPWLHVCLEQV